MGERLQNVRRRGGSNTVAPGTKETVLDYSICGRDEDNATFNILLVNNIEKTGILERNIRPIAEISIGCGGVGVNFECDYLNGQSVNGSGNAVRVVGRNERSDTPAQDRSVDLGAYLSYGATTRNQQLTRSFFVDNAMANLDFLDFRVPAFAGQVQFHRTPFARTFRIQCMDGVLSIVYQVDIAASAIMAPLQLAIDVFTIRLINIDAQAIDKGRMVFLLNL